jgi:Tfp pilus assembly protein PilF
MKRIAAIAISAALLAGCESQPVRSVQAAVQSFIQPHKGADALATGLKQYENGEYAESAKSLQSALDLGLGDRDQVNARKHLAFIHCASGRIAPCREEFRRALAIEPGLELAPAEAGHPTWGPVFRDVKARR